MQQFLFFLFSVIVIISALLVVTTRNLFHAALFLILSFFGVAGFYVLLDAGFFAVAQVLVYIGAISILIIFAVMLTRGMQNMPTHNSQALTALIACGIMFVVLFLVLQPFIINVDLSRVSPLLFANSTARQLGGIPWAGNQNFSKTVIDQPITNDYIANFGKALTDPGQYAVPFELASVLILLALIGAIWVARERHVNEVLAERADIVKEIAAEQPKPEVLPEPAAAAAHADTH
jgi:NADH-quinone oxidoreductase subunit J